MKVTKVNISKRRKIKEISFILHNNRYLFAINTIGRYFIKEYDKNNNLIYIEYNDGRWEKMKYIDDFMVYKETSKSGVFLDRRQSYFENKMHHDHLNTWFRSKWRI